LARFFVREDAGSCFVRGTVEAIYDNHGRLIQPGKLALKAEFTRGAPIWAIRQIEGVFRWDRMPPGWEPSNWVAWFDSGVGQVTYGWSDEDRVAVEEALASGRFPGLVEVEVPKVGVPYKKYLTHRKVSGRRTIEHVLADIGAAIDAAGVSPQAVIEYEQDHHDGLSDQIIQSMSLLADQVEAEDDEELISA
jgi:hypothetical protein